MKFSIKDFFSKWIFHVHRRTFEHHHRIPHIRFGLNTQFHLKQIIQEKWTLQFRSKFFSKKGISGLKQGNEHHHRIRPVWISLGAKLHLSQAILTFWTKFYQKGYFQSKRGHLNIIIEFSIHLNEKTFLFLSKSTQKGFFQPKRENMVVCYCFLKTKECAQRLILHFTFINCFKDFVSFSFISDKIIWRISWKEMIMHRLQLVFV